MKEFFEKNKIFIAVIISFIVGGFIGYLVKTHEIQQQLFALELENEGIKGTPVFLMGNNLSCQILYSTNKEEVGKKISLLNLLSNNPGFLSSDGGTFPLQKVFETDDTLTVLSVASYSGGIDAFVLNKKTGIFSKVSAGSILGIYAIASKGNCK